jgi:hypothetical protein
MNVINLYTNELLLIFKIYFHNIIKVKILQTAMMKKKGITGGI